MSPELLPLQRPMAILLIEDDEDVAIGFTALLAATARYTVQWAPTAAASRMALQTTCFDAVVTDLSLPDGDGFSLIEEIATAHPALPLVCLTGRDDVSSAVHAMRAGAIDFLTKPAPGARLLQVLERVATLSTRRSLPPPGPGVTAAPRQPVGRSPAWRRTVGLIEAAARSPRTTVLLTGESGVGKEEAARLLHRLGPRAVGPFVALNAACVSPGLVDSELFGHEAGAFTGASRQRRGVFEQAHQGTLFLDEIGEMSLETQAKLLRVLEGHPFCRVGGERPVTVDVRLVCATHRDLGAGVTTGTFRADLLARLRVFEIALPPLRQRAGDVARLAHHFVQHLGAELGLGGRGLAPEALAALEGHDFPGNVRELRNILERALILADGGRIERRHLPSLAAAPLAAPPPPPGPLVNQGLDEVTREHILRVYERCGGNVTHAALELQISRLTLRRRLQSYGVRHPSSG